MSNLKCTNTEGICIWKERTWIKSTTQMLQGEVPVHQVPVRDYPGAPWPWRLTPSSGNCELLPKYGVNLWLTLVACLLSLFVCILSSYSTRISGASLYGPTTEPGKSSVSEVVGRGWGGAMLCCEGIPRVPLLRDERRDESCRSPFGPSWLLLSTWPG